MEPVTSVIRVLHAVELECGVRLSDMLARGEVKQMYRSGEA